MTKSTSKAARKTTITVAGTAVKATPVRRRKVETPVVEAPVVAEAPVVEAPVVEAPVVAEAVFTIPDLGKEDLVIGREGFHQLPGKTWNSLASKFGKHTVRQAIAAMVALELRLPLALELATWPAFRPHMLAQLKAVADNKDVLNVLEWVWQAGEGWTWREAYEAFPRVGVPGGTATKAEIGKLNKLVGLMDKLRKEGKTSARGLDYLAQACHLLGWIK